MATQFTVSAYSELTPEAVVDEIFNVDNWPGFTGRGPVPGITEARVIEETATRVGTRIAVTNTDGSTHEETVTEYLPGKRLVMQISDFSAPLNRLADRFTESWEFERRGNQTVVERSFTLHAKGLIGKLILPFIGISLKKAVAAHTQNLAGRP